MNKKLVERYKKLNENEKNELTHRLKKSPLAIKLTAFLEDSKQLDFKNSEVVNYLYANEKEEYKTLENRYFKLRKKFLDEYLNLKEDVAIYTEEEQIFAQILMLLHNGKNKEAFLKLKKLETYCWENNIFEMLPKVIDQMIFCNQVFNEIEKNEQLYLRLKESISLNSEFAKFNMITRRLYEDNLMGNRNEVNLQLKRLKKISIKYKKYPRFSLSYHHIALYFKAASNDYYEYINVINRHYRNYNELHKKHPNMPMMLYKPNYILYQNFHYRQISVFYYYNKCEFLEAYTIMKELYKMTSEEDNIYGIYKTDSIFINMMSVLIGCKFYKEALKLVDDYIKFIKNNNLLYEKIDYAYILKLLVTIESYPVDNNLVNSKELLKRLNRFIKSLRNKENKILPLNQVMAIKSMYYFCLGNYKKAYQYLLLPITISYYKEQDVHEDYIQLFEICSKNKIHTSKDILNKLIFQNELILSNNIHPEKYKRTYWLIKVCKHLLNNSAK